MILFNKYETLPSDIKSNNNPEWDNISKIICEKNKIYENDDYIFYKYDDDIDISNSISSKWIVDEDKEKLISTACEKKLRQVFNINLISSHTLKISKYIICKTSNKSCKIFKKIINNQVNYIEFYKHRRILFIPTGDIHLIFIHKKYIKNFGQNYCGISKNKRINKLLISHIFRQDKYDIEFKILILNWVGWNKNFYNNRDMKQLYENYIKFKKDINISCKYIVRYSHDMLHYNNETIIIINNIFMMYIIKNGIIEFLDNILISEFEIYHLKTYKKILQFIYPFILDNNILTKILPGNKNKIYKYLISKNNKIQIDIDEYVHKINNYKQIGLCEKIKSCIEDDRSDSKRFSILDSDSEYKKYFTLIEQLIHSYKIYKIHIDIIK